MSTTSAHFKVKGSSRRQYSDFQVRKLNTFRLPMKSFGLPSCNLFLFSFLYCVILGAFWKSGTMHANLIGCCILRWRVLQMMKILVQDVVYWKLHLLMNTLVNIPRNYSPFPILSEAVTLPYLCCRMCKIWQHIQHTAWSKHAHWSAKFLKLLSSFI